MAFNSFNSWIKGLYVNLGRKRSGKTFRTAGRKLPASRTKLQFENLEERLAPAGGLVEGFSTYLGGNGNDGGGGIAVDASGNTYVAGFTASTNFPTTAGAYRTSPLGNGDGFVTKLSAAGAPIYSTFIGDASATDIRVDGTGNAFVLGGDGFVGELNTLGTVLTFSTHLFGGAGITRWSDIAVDTSGNLFITGITSSTDFPTTAGAFQTSHSSGGSNFDAFVTKLNADGTISYSTYLGASVDGDGPRIAVDGFGNAFVSGTTASTNFPTTAGAFQTTSPGGDSDAFVAKLNADGTALIYSTYLGGNLADVATGIAVDASGNAYVTGSTSGATFPTTTGAYQSSHALDANNRAAFVTKLNEDGTALSYSTLVGGSGNPTSGRTIGTAIAVDGSGNAYATGFTFGSDFATTAGAYQTSPGGIDAFLAKLNADGTALSYGTYLGGNGDDRGHGLAVDGSGNAYVSGTTFSANFPVTDGAFQTSHADDFYFNTDDDENENAGDAFVVKLQLGEPAVSVVGTQGSDIIAIAPGTQSGTLMTTVNGVVTDNIMVNGYVLVNGLNGNDTITVTAVLAGGLIVDGGNGSDAYDITFGSLVGTLSVADSGSSGADDLTVHGTSAADYIFKDQTKVTLGSPVQEKVYFSGIETKTIHGGGGDDTIVDPGSDTTIFGDEGNDTIIINATAGTGVTVDGGAGSDTYVIGGGVLAGPVDIADSGTSGADSVAIVGTPGDDTLVQTTSGFILNGAVINVGTSLETATVDGGGGAGDTFTVQGTPTIVATVQGVSNTVISGTGGNDIIRLVATNNPGEVKGYVNGALVGTFRPTGQLIVYGLDGNDTISADGVNIPVVLEGGDGNDILTGGSGDDVIFGGAGNDTITGGAGNDFLVGGDGADRIVGSAGNDILVAGDISSVLDLATLRAVSQAWAASRTVNDSAVDDFLDETVFSDAAVDQLTGSGGADLFIIGSDDKITDFQFGKPQTNKDGDVVIRNGVVVI